MAHTKNRYPFLACWKQQGFDKFPSVPVEAIIEYYRRSFYQFLKDHGRTALKTISLKERPDPLESEIIKAAEELFDKDAKVWMLKAARRLVTAETWEAGLAAIEARNRVIKGEDREKVLRELGNEIFPDTKGGASIFTEHQKRTLKVLYLELQGYIKEIRRLLDIPLIESPGYVWGEDESENIQKEVPEALDIFVDHELPIISRKPSVAETASEIIARRIRPTIKFSISFRTLRDILTKVPILIS